MLSVILIMLFLCQEPRAVSAQDPVAFYLLNGNCGTREFLDRLDKGIAVGVELAPGPDDKPDGSYRFSGTDNSYIEFPNTDGRLDTKNSITLLCWVNPAGPAEATGPLFHYLPNSSDWGVHLWFMQGKLFARFTNRIEDGYTAQLVDSDPIQLNTWSFVGASYDQNTGTARLWRDGNMVAELNIGNITLATQDNARMGAKDKDNRYFKGRVARMQVYDVALTQEHVQYVKDLSAAFDRPCPDENPCKNGAEYENSGSSYTCKCKEGFEGKDCENAVDACANENPCKNGAECENSGSSYICKCKGGFEGKDCENDLNECQSSSPCQNGGECENTFGGYTCACKPGFTGDNCEQDIDDCLANSVVCYNGGQCVDQPNDYVCDCHEGYIGHHCEWEAKGCFVEVKKKKNQAMGRRYKVVRNTKKDTQAVVETCRKQAEKAQLEIFGIRNKNKCVTTKGSAAYDRHGASAACKQDGDFGIGVKLDNFVYILKKEG